jgi:hypothetical protein
MIKFTLKGGNILKKILTKPFFGFSVSAILIFILLFVHYPWWIALFNSLAIVIVGVLINIAVKKINRNRNRYFPRWFTPLIWFFVLIIIESYVSLIEAVWITVFGVLIITILFPELPEK